MQEQSLELSTLEGIESRAQGRLAVWGRRGFLLLLLAFVAAGLSGVLGVRTTTSTAEQDGWSVSVEHASISRAGLDSPFEVTVTHPGGFGKELTLALTGSYFDIFESQGFFPEPSDETRDGETLYLTFAAPAGDTFVLAFDAYVQPASQVGRSGTVAVVDDGERVAGVGFRTVLLP